MFSFLFHAGSEINQVEQSLRKASSAMRQFASRLDDAISTQIQLFPEVLAGWSLIEPEEHYRAPYTSAYSDKSVAVIAYGTSIDGSKVPLAEILAKAWNGDVMSLRRLDNLFSAIVIDRLLRKIYLVSDQIGLRTVHYYTEAGQIWVAPHDVPIVAASACSLDINLLAVYGIYKAGWSLNGAPLLRDLHVLDAKWYYTWEGGKLTQVNDHLFNGVERLQSHDEPGKRKLLDSLIDHLNARISTIIESYDTVGLDLTAGWDTRTILALLLHNADDRKLKVFTKDLIADKEYQAAKWIASHYHLEHLRSGPKPSTPEVIEKDVSMHAFCSNGKGTCFRVFNTGTIRRDPDIPQFTGHNTGFFRGILYPKKANAHIHTEPMTMIEQHIASRIVDSNTLITSSEWDAPLRNQLNESIRKLADISQHPFDLCDLFYLYERIGYYSTRDAVNTIETGVQRMSVFESPMLTREASRMPSPISQDMALQRKIIRMYAPRSYYKLINDRIFPPAKGNPTLHWITKHALRLRAKLNVVINSPERSTTDQIAQRRIDELLMNVVKERVLDSNSVLFSVIKKSRLDKLVHAQTTPDTFHKTIIGHLINFETWHQQIKEARSNAQNLS